MPVPTSLFEPLPTPEEMRTWDEAAQNLFGMPSFLLMINAAQEAWNVIEATFAPNPPSKVLIVVGGGNNGGDGAALARRLHEAGSRVLIYCSRPLESLRGAAAEHVGLARACGIPFLPKSESPTPALPPDWGAPELIVDALTGTGIRGDLREPELALVRWMNEFHDRSFILSLDIPSGLCGYTGQARPEAVRADATVTFEAGKPGLYIPEARPYTGTVVIRPIGMPPGVQTAAPPSWRLLNPKPGTFPLPSPLRHKGDGGRVLIVGGSAGMAGAPVLAGLGALRAGAGLVHVAHPGGLAAPCAAFPELMSHTVGSGQTWAPAMAAELPALVERIRPNVIVVGPGLGRSDGARAAVKNVLAVKRRPPLVLDADALSFFRLQESKQENDKGRKGHYPLQPQLLREDDIVTPHPGEMAGLLPCSYFPDPKNAAEDPAGKECILRVQEDRGGAMRAFTRESPAVLVLKGAGTLIGRRGAPTTLCPIASPALGVGGSGDVLAGVIAALAAGGYESLEAACLGVHLHARAGRLLEAASPLGHRASEIAGAVPAAQAELYEPANAAR